MKFLGYTVLVIFSFLFTACNQSECVSIKEGNALYYAEPSLWDKFKNPNFDTLVVADYNLSKDSFNFEQDLLFHYHSEMDVQIEEIRFSKRKRHLEGGRKRSIKYSFSHVKPTYTDESGGKWYDTWSVKIAKYEDSQKAVRAFNKTLLGLNDYNKDPYLSKGNDSRTFISGANIVEIEGSCRTGWFVSNALERILDIYFDSEKLAPNTLVRTWCGGGARSF